MFKNYFSINESYLAQIKGLKLDLQIAHATIDELRELNDKQSNVIIDLCVTNSSAELIAAEMESQKTEITKWQNKYIDLVNRSLTKVPVFEEDKIEAGEQVDKEPINQRTPWYVRRRQLENEDRKRAEQLRVEAASALSKVPSIEKLNVAVKDLEDDFEATTKEG